MRVLQAFILFFPVYFGLIECKLEFYELMFINHRGNKWCMLKFNLRQTLSKDLLIH